MLLRAFAAASALAVGAHAAGPAIGFRSLRSGKGAGAASVSGVGEPRLVTPLILAGASPAAIFAATAVTLPNITRPSFTGFIEVNATAGAQHFYWYWPPPAGGTPTAVIAWHQGGPGGSSLFGLFTELGPYRLDASLNPVPNPGTWCTGTYACVFLDNPRNT